VVDYSGAYAELRARVSALVRGRNDADLERVAPATPEWKVKDVVAHLAGVCDDVSNGNMAGVASDDWTAAQVAKRRNWPIDKVLADWDEQAAKIEPMMNDLGPAIGQMLADAATHEQDVRGALGEPGGRDSSAVEIGMEWALQQGLTPRYESEGRGMLRVEHEAGTSTAGSGEPVTTLRTSRFEFVRAMAGRRSVNQMKAYEWDGPLGPDDILMATFFTPRAADLVE
jgi:uncharacterized protein (TIGR03083 family)